MKITEEQKQEIRMAVLEARNNYGGTAESFAKSMGLSESKFSRINTNKIEKLLSDSEWIQLARKVDFNPRKDNWVTVKTKVYKEIEDGILFCKQNSKATMLVDNCGIGKTFCSKKIVKGITNAFYVDCSQAKSKIQFFRLLARVIGVNSHGKYFDVKEDIKFGLNFLEDPVIVLDEFGDLEYSTFLDIKEVMNSTICGWYAMGADGLRAKINKGISNEKVGFAEVFDRFSAEFTTITPYTNIDDQKAFRRELLTQVASVNNTSCQPTETLVLQCMKNDGSLRKLETLIKISA